MFLLFDFVADEQVQHLITFALQSSSVSFVIMISICKVISLIGKAREGEAKK